MPNYVMPHVFMIGEPCINYDGLNRYLEHIGATDFNNAISSAIKSGLSDAEILCSVFSKLCYKSFDVSRNINLTKTRDIYDNITNCFETGHGSVFEHVYFNFIISDCSRVFTHELVRHRVGVAFSQTSGRYCRLDSIPFVFDPVLEPVKDKWAEQLTNIEELIYYTECVLGLRVPPPSNPEMSIEDSLLHRAHARNGGYTINQVDFNWVPSNLPFSKKKKLTSAIRRIAPNGQSNEIGYSVNLREIRHTILMRTAAVAEWEIRYIFNLIYNIMKDKYPLMFYGAKEAEVDGLLEITGMKCQPYEKAAQVVLDELTDEQLELYLETRPKRS